MKNSKNAEVGSIEREIYIDAAPETVFEVISQPHHVAQWWPDTASYDVVVGASGEITFGDPSAGGKSVNLTILEVTPPESFSFRWTHEPGTEPDPGNSLLVTFHLRTAGSGTMLTFVETGFREMGWDAAKLELTFNEHVNGWDFFLPRLVSYVDQFIAR